MKAKSGEGILPGLPFSLVDEDTGAEHHTLVPLLDQQSEEVKHLVAQKEDVELLPILGSILPLGLGQILILDQLFEISPRRGTLVDLGV